MDIEQNQKIQEFFNCNYDWSFTAGECNFLIQLLAHLIQDNPAFIRGPKGEKESLNYQSIRTVVLLNDKLSAQFQERAKQASVVLGDVKGHTDRVQ
jgi:hypothetical protein